MTLRKSLLSLLSMLTLTAGAQVTMTLDATQRGPLTSPYQWGLFFEEINHAGDGGLYAEMVQNRSFDEDMTGWQAYGSRGASTQMLTTGLINDVQRKALRLTTTMASDSRWQGVSNAGYWGMSFVEGKTYTLTLWARGSNSGYTGHLIARLLGSDGQTIVGEAPIEGTVTTDTWTKLTTTITATRTDNSGQLLLLTSNNGRLDLDVVSLFPETWNNRPNGLRPDLAQLLADTKPTFLRFPGGCYVEGEGTFDNAFQWKRTIGPIEQRPGHMNQNWRYWSTDGLGFDEYLQLAEDMGAAPMFVVNVGLGHGFYIPMEDLDTLVQNTLDAIEYANGDGSTYWGAQRIKNGHVAPYNLKFIEIGNENYNFYMNNNGDQSYQYPERYYMFYKAIKEKYPDIITIGNVEAWGTDAPSWRNDYPVELVDEHYYRTSGWMRDNYNKYDNYSRNIGVYNGEFAANSGDWGRYGNLNAALGEAIYMLGQEKNSDVCRMGSFAPIFTHEQDPRWAYDMIHFNAAANFVTPSYHVQKMMANNLGHQNLLWTETNNTLDLSTTTHRVGLATWDTQATFDDLTVTAVTADGSKVVISEDFAQDAAMNPGSGSWTVVAGGYSQTAYGQPCLSVSDASFNAAHYIYNVRARKDGGNEAFLIVFDYQDDQNYAWWNIGGWGNTRNAIEVCRNGSKTQYSEVNFGAETGRWYDLKVEVDGDNVKCYIDGQLYHSLELPKSSAVRALYQSAQLTEDGRELILKVVNPNSSAQRLQLNAKNMTIGSGTVQRLTSARGTDENTMDAPNTVTPVTATVSFGSAEGTAATVPFGSADGNTLDIPPFSLNIYRLQVSDVAAEAPKKTAADYPDYAAEDAGKVAYLYAHMHQTQEYTCYALKTKDAQTWNDLLGGQEVFPTREHTVTGGMRDAFVYRLHSGSGFMLCGTDMTSRLGWNSNHIMVLMTSPDLVHWTKNVKIDLESADNLKAIGEALGREMDAETMTAAWAPQVIYDPVTGKYVLYYSVGVSGDKHYIFYQLIDEQLNILTPPALYFAPGYDVIDADIVWNAVDQQYQMLYKCEATNGFDRATAKVLVPANNSLSPESPSAPSAPSASLAPSPTTVWSVTPNFHVGENNQAIEGMTQWRPIGELKWNLSYINYTNGYHYRLRYMDEHGLNVEPAGHDVSGNVAAQHGCIVKLTQAEYDFLRQWDEVHTLLPAVKAFNNLQPTEQHAAAIAAAETALNTTTTFAENAAAMSRAAELLRACPTDVRQVLIDKVVSDGQGDLTPLIVNADFAKGTEGWSANTTFTAANGYVAEFWNKNFYFWQTVEGLPNGEYEVGVQAFYRNGGGNAERNYAAYVYHNLGMEQLNSIFYAYSGSGDGNTLAEVPVTSLYSADRYTGNPYTFPDNVTTANQAFNDYDLYHNTVRVMVTDGWLTFGIYKDEWVDADWCCFDNFTLTYLGTGTGVSDVKRRAGGDDSDAIYNLGGQRVTAPTKGIYIKNGKKIVK